MTTVGNPYLDDPDEGLSPTTSHPAYVAVAPDWFWSLDDPSAPFGSDSGNDTLSWLQEHFADGGGDEQAAGVVADMVGEWALVPEGVWDGTAEKIEAWLGAEEGNHRLLHAEIDAYVAGACGHFKISGGIHPALRFWAERALMLLEHVLDGWEQKTLGARPGAYAKRLEATRAVIAAAPVIPADAGAPPAT